mgnify:FL=1
MSSISIVSTTFGLSFRIFWLTVPDGWGRPWGQKARYVTYVNPAKAAVGGTKANQSLTKKRTQVMVNYILRFLDYLHPNLNHPPNESGTGRFVR